MSEHTPVQPSPPGEVDPQSGQDTMRQAARLEYAARMDRLDYLATLRDGWHDGHGLAPTPCALAVARDLLGILPRLASPCSSYPTNEGGVLVELVHAGWDYSIEVAAGGGLEMSGVALAGKECMDRGPMRLGDQTFFEVMTMLGAQEESGRPGCTLLPSQTP